jgi:RNA 2',3'-cyclic 3'-phosphodiesterase
VKRIFIGIKIEPEGTLVKMIATLRAVLADDKIKWVDPANIHITLAFLGDMDEERIKVVAIMLSKVCSGFNRFSFNISGTGLFKNFHDPRVIWTGIDNADMLIRLNSMVIRGLSDAGFRLEERSFRPHITLGRIKYVKDKIRLRNTVERFRGKHFQNVDVKEVILFESILKPDGPIYKPSGIFGLS